VHKNCKHRKEEEEEEAKVLFFFFFFFFWVQNNKSYAIKDKDATCKTTYKKDFNHSRDLFSFYFNFNF